MTSSLFLSSRLIRPVSSSSAIALCALAACGSPSNNSSLFSSSGAMHQMDGSAANAGSTQTGISTAGAPSTNAAGSPSTAGSPGVPDGTSGAGSASDGGSPNGGSSDGHVDGPQGGASAAGGNGSGVPGDCSMHGKDATYYSETRHCYLVVLDKNSYADAQAHCASLAAHLVTIGSEGENAFVWSLERTEHWLGMSDGKGAKEDSPGTYSWLTGEPFTYMGWSTNQPDAAKASCGDANGGGDCYEHCGYQWPSGEHPGQWNDRYCLNTIDSICEWDE